nr:uncharacterized protein LOC128687184 [Cherax quadricarinatus]XP_053630492.1 uncharacterized protein LOC128687184 [Cherax quadricarinatus]XP_053630493.1 uncharacterized protein LOC128687184 [Cherax quadricarinatus]
MLEVGGEECAGPRHLAVKISPVRRLCRAEGVEQQPDENEGVTACPQVLRQLCAQLRTPGRSGRGGRGPTLSLAALRSRLASRPYWLRCLCSQQEVPSITERELVPLLSLTPAHRFIVLVVTNSSQSQGSVVVGGESLIKAVYVAQNLPALRPCLQSPSEPSLAFIKYDLAKSKGKRKERKGAQPTLLNGGQVKMGMVLIYKKTQMLYAGFPLASYGCMKQDFLNFISVYAKHDFHLRASPLEPRDNSSDDPQEIPEET